MIYAHLNHNISGTSEHRVNDAWRRVLNRLGDYTSIITQAMHMRPERAELLAQTEHHILVRIRLPGEYVVLRIAPETHLAREVFFGRTMSKHRLPVTRIIHHDFKRSLVPFDYMIEAYIGGQNANQIENPSMQRVIARQVGRAIGQMHRIAAPGWGTPGQTSRWIMEDWHTALLYLHSTLAPEALATTVFQMNHYAEVSEIVHHPTLAYATPNLLHGDVGPHTTRCTVGISVQLAALINPGLVVGGDPLFDLACGMNPHYPQAWRTGLVEGYLSLSQLSMQEQERLHFLRLLTCFWSACQRYAQQQPYAASRDRALALLAERT